MWIARGRTNRLILDLRELDAASGENEAGREIEVDLCILGAGAAGISLALEFANTATTTCLVEGGGIVADRETIALHAGEIVGRSYQPLESTHLRLFGGTTNIWHGACLPLEELDFKTRSWVPHSGWPMSKGELDTYYPRASLLCEITPPFHDEAIWRDPAGPQSQWDADKLVERIWRYSKPTRFGSRYRDDLESAPNLKVLLWANATNIHPNASNNRIEYVEVRSLSGNRARLKARRFVLAMGGIENAHLLLNSTDLEEGGLGNQHDVVGRYFMEHTHTQCGYLYPNDYDDAARRYSWRGLVDGVGIWPGVGLSEKTQRDSEVLACIMRFDPQTEPLRPG